MVKDLVKKFFASKFNQWLVVALALLGFIILVWGGAQPIQEEAEDSGIHFFYLPTCPHCHEQMEKLNPVIEEEYGVKIIIHDASSAEGGVLFQKVTSERGLQGLVPLTLIGKKHFVGYSEEKNDEMKAAVEECLNIGCPDPLTGKEFEAQEQSFEYNLPFIGKTDLRSMSLPMLSIILGIVDGFNPCAMWVLVYLIALCMGLQNKRRMFFIIGTFVGVSGLMYFLFMSAWLNAFLLLGYTRAITILIGLVALAAGILNLKEWWKTRNKALVCEVTGSETKEAQMNQMQKLVASPLTWGTFLAIVILAFAVNTIEFVCSAALPAIFAQVLALTPLSWIEHYGYIALYVFFFMLDDLLMFSIAVFGISSMSANEKYCKMSKLVGGALILIIGLMLLFAPQMLR